MTITTNSTTTSVTPVSGRSRTGAPLAHHRAPPPDLAPWIARMFVTVADQPAEQTLQCGLLNDTGFVRVIVRGEWEGFTANGPIRRSSGTLLFGPHTRRMAITVRGPFATFGFALRPGARHALGHPWGPIGADTIAIISDPLWTEFDMLDRFDEVASDRWLALLEERLRILIERLRPPPPDALAEAFDLAAFDDPTEAISAFAQRQGVSDRAVARMAHRSFAMTPKHVMRRARVLDMASQIIGVADREEAEEHAMRFYDQSHLIRDFRDLMGMTPSELARRPHPILSLGLEPRQARRLEAIGRLERGERPPWR